MSLVVKYGEDEIINAAGSCSKVLRTQGKMMTEDVEIEFVEAAAQGRLIYSDYDADGLPQQLEYVPASPLDTKLPDRFCSYGHQYTATTWNSRLKNIVCPDHITELGSGGFAMGGFVPKKLSNWNKIKKAGRYSFSGAISCWDYDYLPPSLEYIDEGAFERNALNVNNLWQLPENVEYIGTNAFVYCNGHQAGYEIILPQKLKYIGNSAFYNNGFQMFPMILHIPASIETIGNTPFGGGAFQTIEVIFHGKPNSIAAKAFETSNSNGSMKALTSIKVPWSEGEVANAPWGAVNATITYNYTES